MFYMRTKKFLSILLAVIMTLGVCGVGVSAAELTGDSEAFVQAKWSELGNNLVVTENKNHSKGMGTAEFRWIPYTNDAGSVDAAGSFYGDYKKGADCTWEYWRVIDGVDTLFAVQTDELKAASTTGAYFVVGKDYVTLTVGQPTNVKWYGTVKVKLTVTVTGAGGVQETKESLVVTAVLSDNKKIAEKINEAKEEVAKTDRYTKAYLDNLQLTIDKATILISGRPTDAQQTDFINYLELAINGFDAAGVTVGKRYKLSGVDFIDNLFSDSFLAGLWKVIDVFNSIMSVVNPLIDFFGQIGDFFGNLMPIFTFIFGLIFP